MRKALTIAWSEFSTALTSKAFLIGIMLVPGLMVGSILFQRFMGQRVDRQDRAFVVIDHTNELYPVVAGAADAWNARQGGKDGAPQTGPRFLPSRATLDGKPIEQLRAELSDRIARKELFAFVEIPADALAGDDRKAPIRYHSNHPSYNRLPNWIDTVLNGAIAASRLSKAGVDVSLLKALQVKVPIEHLGLLQRQSDGQIREAERVDRVKTLAIPAVLMVMMFMVVMSSASPLLNSVMEEKMTRISEVLLGSVTPFELMLGKLLGSLLVSLVLSLVYLGVGFGAASYWGYGNAVPPWVFAWFVVYLIAAILMFGGAFMAIGAACTDLKDAQGMMTPVMLIFCLPMFVWTAVLQSPDSLFSSIASLVPIATPMLMLLRLTLQPGPPVWQIGLSLVLTIGTSLLIVWAAGKVFRTGILMQGKSATLGEMLRWVRA
jgi:ABC-2 type transport system permease protein